MIKQIGHNFSRSYKGLPMCGLCGFILKPQFKDIKYCPGKPREKFEWNKKTSDRKEITKGSRRGVLSP